MTPSLRQSIGSLRAGALDLSDRLRGGRLPLHPPRRLAAEVGSGDFAAVGREFYELFRRAGLERDHDVLDVGCGAGRMARPLAGWLRGRYEGFDAQVRAIRWCERNYAGHPNFRFRHVDVGNDAYNPGGKLRAGELEFPYEDGSFDFAIATSVFTHLSGEVACRYLGELGRVLRPGGTLFGTWLLLDAEVENALAHGRTALELPVIQEDPDLGRSRLASRKTPSAAVAFESDRVETAHARSGFEVAERWPGAWGGRSAAASWQDVIVAIRR